VIAFAGCHADSVSEESATEKSLPDIWGVLMEGPEDLEADHLEAGGDE
jgi:hypothetical protein